MKLYVSLVLNLALLMVNGSTGWGPVAHRMEVRQDRPEADKDVPAERGIPFPDNMMREPVEENERMMYNKMPVMPVREPVKENERMLYNKMPVREPVKENERMMYNKMPVMPVREPVKENERMMYNK